MTNHSYPPDKCTFELLSAYLDGEVTAEQRKEVQELLSNSEEIQGLYTRLLYLRQEINSLPTPQPEYSAKQLSDAVFAKVDQQNKQRKIWLWGGGAIAAVLLTAVGSLINDNRTPLLQMAQENSSTSNKESLVIALNEPIIEMPVENNQETLMIPLDHSLIDLSENK
ncbi:anti-sigma factor [Geminocystis sp.]|uniref:anti-sigma factor family protein n=1 Tax=Geminocystis sp. TaxID=2664100 RepID=UPI0035934D6F